MPEGRQEWLRSLAALSTVVFHDGFPSLGWQQEWLPSLLQASALLGMTNDAQVLFIHVSP